MTDIIGPIIAILLILGVYYVAQQLDVSGETKLSRLDIRKTEARTREEEAKAHSRELELEFGRLAIEARKLDRIEHKPSTGATEAEFKVLKELEDKEKRNK